LATKLKVMEVVPGKQGKYVLEHTPKARTAPQGFNEGKVGFAEMNEEHLHRGSSAAQPRAFAESARAYGLNSSDSRIEPSSRCKRRTQRQSLYMRNSRNTLAWTVRRIRSPDDTSTLSGGEAPGRNV
jgi:hypothetical protein